MNCKRVSDAGLAEAYLPGRLAEAQCEDYERQFFECEQCAAELQALRLAREEFLATQLMSREITVSPPALRWRVRWGWAADPDDAGAPFFLGISRLLANDGRGGIEALRAAIARGDTPHLEEARLCLARAHLRAGDPDLAIAELRAVIQLRGDFEAEASQLVEEIKEVR